MRFSAFSDYTNEKNNDEKMFKKHRNSFELIYIYIYILISNCKTTNKSQIIQF